MTLTRRLAPALLLATCLCLPAAAAAKGSKAKIKDIQTLLKLSGADTMGQQILTQMIANFRASMPDVPGKLWDRFLKKADTRDLLRKIVPIYDKHLAHEDIKGLIAFYKSPLGRKFVRVQPQLVADSMQAGQQWGRGIAEQLMREVQKSQKRKGK
jgi:hypothetical protein